MVKCRDGLSEVDEFAAGIVLGELGAEANVKSSIGYLKEKVLLHQYS